jgi:putative spermidine/putrescine transport system permease protein
VTRAAAVLVASFAIMPIAIVVVMAFNTSQFLRFPPDGFSTHLFQEVVGSPRWRHAFRTTLVLGLLSAPLATLLALSATLGLRRFTRRAALQSILMLPLIVPVVVIAFALVPVYTTTGLAGTMLGLVILHTLLALPFGFTILWGSIEVLDSALELAAASLGASGWTTIRRVIVPPLAPAIISSLIACTVISFDEVVATLFLSAPGTRTVPIEIWLKIGQDFSPTAASASVLVLILNLLVLAVGTAASRLLVKRGLRMGPGRDHRSLLPPIASVSNSAEETQPLENGATR